MDHEPRMDKSERAIAGGIAVVGAVFVFAFLATTLVGWLAATGRYPS